MISWLKRIFRSNKTTGDNESILQFEKEIIENKKITMRLIEDMKINILPEEVLPPWIKYPEIAAGSIGWRMGYGEGYLYSEYYPYVESLTEEEKDAYFQKYDLGEEWPDRKLWYPPHFCFDEYLADMSDENDIEKIVQTVLNNDQHGLWNIEDKHFLKNEKGCEMEIYWQRSQEDERLILHVEGSEDSAQNKLTGIMDRLKIEFLRFDKIEFKKREDSYG